MNKVERCDKWKNIGTAHQTNVCDETLLQINKKKTNKPIEKWTKVVNKTFSENTNDS